jgi:hypothetical protein
VVFLALDDAGESKLRNSETRFVQSEKNVHLDNENHSDVVDLPAFPRQPWSDTSAKPSAYGKLYQANRLTLDFGKVIDYNTEYVIKVESSMTPSATRLVRTILESTI